MNRFGAIAIAAALCIQAWAGPDLVLVDGVVYTVDEANPRAEAIAIEDGRITAVGENAAIRAMADGDTRVESLGGRAVVPGFIDAHGHIGGLGSSLESLDLVGTESYEAIVARVATRVATLPDGAWVTGRGWDQNDWAEAAFPQHDALSAVSPDHPTFLVRVDGHAALANGAALAAAGIDGDTPDPPGGRIMRNDDGEATGVLIDAAMGIVSSHIPRDGSDQRRTSMVNAMDVCVRHGLTSVHDAGVSGRAVDVYRALADEDAMPMRIYVMLRGNERRTLKKFFEDGPYQHKGGMLTVRSVKAMNDGALGSRGAALMEAYSDEPGSRGLTLMSGEALSELTRDALAAGFQVCTHSIGDRANHETLNAYEAALKEVPTKDHRLRIEHAQVIARDDIPRFAALGVIPSMQATHATSDMYWAEARLGPERIKGAYAWRTLMDTGCRIANGSDFPVEHVNPLWGFYAAITRQDHKGFPEGGWRPEERMTREEALKSFTLDSAYAAFQEEELGSIVPGKYADLVVLSSDIMTIAPKAILETEVECVYVGGIQRYRRAP